MNFNFTLINEFISFIIFFYFSCFFIFPIITKILNKYNLNNLKNNSFIKFNQTLENNLIKNLYIIENKIKDKINFVLYYINNIFFKKKDNLLDFFLIEKEKIFNKINILFKKKKNNLIKRIFVKLKLSFVKSFKDIYNEIINYNNEFIINYD
ncbi:MAG: hypothetical protein NVS86_00030 [Candidatus Carsonella ruddii]|nr:MAG: hypothetical protein NVS86_00030 [Candidatus Carsonella ruddii]